MDGEVARLSPNGTGDLRSRIEPKAIISADSTDENWDLSGDRSTGLLGK
jgi:hypothetical protein